MNMSVDMQGVVCGALMSVVAAAACVQEARRRRTGPRMRIRAGWELMLIVALAIATCVAVTMKDVSLLWPALIALAAVVILMLHAERA